MAEKKFKPSVLREILFRKIEKLSAVESTSSHEISALASAINKSLELESREREKVVLTTKAPEGIAPKGAS